MKFQYKKGVVVLVLVLSVLCGVRSVHAQAVESEHIEQLNTAISIQKDSSIDVSETIVYVFPSGEERHGIYRTIPLKDIYLSDVAVTDDHGVPYDFDTSRSGGSETIKIGDPNSTVHGTKTYVITYHVAGAIADQKDIDELYWNATGNEWGFPILHTHQSVSFPSTVTSDKLKIACYQGTYGSNSLCKYSTLSTNLAEGTQIDFVQTQPLAAGEGVTIAIGFPKGIVVHPTAWQKFLMVLQHNILLVLSVLAFLASVAYSLYTWLRNGREPKGSGVIVAQYDVPEQLHPSELSALLHKKVQDGDISAEIINLAVHGYLKIEKIETKVLVFTTDDYRLILLRDMSEAHGDIDPKLIAGLFGGAARAGETVLLSDLKGSFYATVASVKKAVMQALVAREYFAKNPSSVRKAAGGIFVIGVVVAIFSLTAIASSGASLLAIPFVFLAIAIFALFKYLSTPRTAKGVAVKEYVLGLKEYLQIAEKDRINFHNAPEKRPELFEALLPYAMVLGVEKAWAKEFEGVYVTPPNWYVDPHMSGFNTFVFVNSFSSFNGAMASSSAAPRSSGSASGGGGFSGGGGGGGGGGSW